LPLFPYFRERLRKEKQFFFIKKEPISAKSGSLHGGKVVLFPSLTENSGEKRNATFVKDVAYRGKGKSGNIHISGKLAGTFFASLNFLPEPPT